MPYALLPGSRAASTRTQTLLPVTVAIVVTIAGVGYFAFRPATNPAPPSGNVAPAVDAINKVNSNNDRKADDLALHLRNVRTDVREAVNQISRARRLTETAGRSLDDTNMAVEARRVRAAAAASTAALNALAHSLEELEVSSNAINNKEN